MKPASAVGALVPLGFLGIFFLYPVLAMLWRGLGRAPGTFLSVITDQFFLRIVWFTLWQAVASTVLTLIIAAPLTWAVARFTFRGRALTRALVTVPFVLPTVVVAGAFIAALDRLHLESARHSVGVVLAAHVFFNIAVVVRTVGGFWSRLDRGPEEAASVLGATPWVTFREITLHRLRRPIFSAVSIIFLFTFTSFGTVLLLGGPRMQTIETEIYRYAINRIDFETAAALGTVQLLAVLALVFWNSRLNHDLSTQGHSASETFARDYAQPATTHRQRLMVGAAVGTTLMFVFVPILAMVEQSLRRNGTWSLANFASLDERPALLPASPLRALINSMQFGIAATGIAIIVGGLSALTIVHGNRAVSQILDLGLILPLGTSAVTLGFGMLIALDEAPLDLRTSWWLIPIAQSLIGIPFVIRAVVPVLRSIDHRMREAASTLGATPREVRREIDAPLAAQALATGAGFSFAISLGEFGATLMLGRRGDQLTMPLAIERLLGQPGELLQAQAMALAVILMLVTTTVMLLADRAHRGGLL